VYNKASVTISEHSSLSVLGGQADLLSTSKTLRERKVMRLSVNSIKRTDV
jgi:hypothetical protein